MRRPASLPPNITLHEDADFARVARGYRRTPAPRGLTLVRRWCLMETWAIAALGVICAAVIAASLLSESPEPVAPAVLIGRIATGVVALYVGLAMLVNRTTLAVSGDTISVRHAPLPWWGNARRALGDVVGIACVEEICRGVDGPSRHHHLDAVLRDGRRVRIVASLPERDQAAHLAERLEERLGLAGAVDQPPAIARP